MLVWCRVNVYDVIPTLNVSINVSCLLVSSTRISYQYRQLSVPDLELPMVAKSSTHNMNCLSPCASQYRCWHDINNKLNHDLWISCLQPRFNPIYLINYNISFRPSHLSLLSQPTRGIHPRLFQCWHTIFDTGPTFKQHWVNAACLLGWSPTFI